MNRFRKLLAVLAVGALLSLSPVTAAFADGPPQSGSGSLADGEKACVGPYFADEYGPGVRMVGHLLSSPELGQAKWSMLRSNDSQIANAYTLFGTVRAFAIIADHTPSEYYYDFPGYFWACVKNGAGPTVEYSIEIKAAG